MKKRTIFGLIGLLSFSFTSCLNSSSSYDVEIPFTYRAVAQLSDTMWINPDYDNPSNTHIEKSAQVYIDTTLGRYLLDRDLLLNQTYTIKGENAVDVDTTLYNIIEEKFYELLPSVEAIDFNAVLQDADSVIECKAEIVYEVINSLSGFPVIRDTITVVTIEAVE